MQVPEVSRPLDHLIGHGLDVRVVQKVQIVLFQHEGGGRLRTNDRDPFACYIGQDAQIVSRDFPSTLYVAVGEGSHAAAALVRRHVDLDTVVVEHRNDGLSDFGIVVVGKDVDEI